MNANRVEWLEVGKEICPDPISQEFYLDTVKLIDEGHDEHHEFDKWVPPSASLPFSQGYALRAMVKGFRLPHVAGLCYSNNWFDGELVGVRGTFKTAAGGLHSVDVFAVDRGDLLTPVCTRVWEGVEK